MVAAPPAFSMPAFTDSATGCDGQVWTWGHIAGGRTFRDMAVHGVDDDSDLGGRHGGLGFRCDDGSGGGFGLCGLWLCGFGCGGFRLVGVEVVVLKAFSREAAETHPRWWRIEGACLTFYTIDRAAV